MQIHGFQKTTLLDYPGHVASVVFTGGCNFRCPFCQNRDLVLNPAEVPLIDEKDIFAHLEKRKGILDGICITGGEPTLQKDLPEFIKRARDLGYSIKLDTNGYRPDVLNSLLEKGLLDYVAMDIKHSPEKYPVICNVPDFKLQNINDSIRLLKNGKIPYEFRTTVIKEFHKESDFVEIGNWLAGSMAYYLQSYKDSDQVISPGFHPYPKETLIGFQTILKEQIDLVEIRGID